MPLINYEINFLLTWSMNFAISNTIVSNDTTFTKTDTKFYAPVVTLSTQDNTKDLNAQLTGININQKQNN